MINYIRKFGFWEYILFFGGFAVFGKLVYSFMSDTLENNMVNGVALIFSVLFMAAPKIAVKIFKDKANSIIRKPDKK